jgi:hypothetical protein
MLVAKIDELVDMTAPDLDEIRAVTEQLEPERARSCRNALTMAAVMIDEVRLRAHTPPGLCDDSAPGDTATYNIGEDE